MQGTEIDPVSGRPIEMVLAEAEAHLARTLQENLDGSEILKTELAAPQGRLLRAALEKRLLDRMNLLMSKDEQCLAILGIAEEIGVQLQVLPQMAEREIRRRMMYEG